MGVPLPARLVGTPQDLLDRVSFPRPQRPLYRHPHAIAGRTNSMTSTGLEAVYLANRDKLIRFLTARGAGDAAEDLANDLWVKISAGASGPISNPLSYLYRAADTLMIDRYRSRRQAELRDNEWSDTIADGDASQAPSSERVIAARQEAQRVAALLAGLGARRDTVFRRARLDGIPQRQIAQELGVSLSTVENDLRIACRALAELKDQLR